MQIENLFLLTHELAHAIYGAGDNRNPGQVSQQQYGPNDVYGPDRADYWANKVYSESSNLATDYRLRVNYHGTLDPSNINLANGVMLNSQLIAVGDEVEWVQRLGGNTSIQRSDKDTLILDVSATGRNDLVVGAGSDYIYGFSGNDTIFGSLGNDTLSGGSGIDTLDYSTYAGEGVRVTLGSGGAR